MRRRHVRFVPGERVQAVHYLRFPLQELGLKPVEHLMVLRVGGGADFGERLAALAPLRNCPRQAEASLGGLLTGDCREYAGSKEAVGQPLISILIGVAAI